MLMGVLRSRRKTDQRLSGGSRTEARPRRSFGSGPIRARSDENDWGDYSRNKNLDGKRLVAGRMFGPRVGLARHLRRLCAFEDTSKTDRVGGPVSIKIQNGMAFRPCRNRKNRTHTRSASRSCDPTWVLVLVVDGRTTVLRDGSPGLAGFRRRGCRIIRARPACRSADRRPRVSRMRKTRQHKSVPGRLDERLARDLNESQLAAATAPDGYNLILAGPGSGKTRVITYRVAYLIAQGVPAESILLVTFTRRAAREMVGRLETLIGPPPARVWAGTFHHIGNRLLRRVGRACWATGRTSRSSTARTSSTSSGWRWRTPGSSAPARWPRKPAPVQHLISFAFNAGRPLAEIVTERHPEPGRLAPAARTAGRALRRAEARRQLHGLRRPARPVGPADRRVPRPAGRPGADVPPHPDRRDAGHEHRPGRPGRGDRRRRGRQPDGRRRRRAVDLPVPGRQLRQHPQVPRAPPRRPPIFRLETNYRSTPEIVAFTNASIAHNRLGLRQDARLGPAGRGARPSSAAAADAYEEADFLCQQILEIHEEGTALEPDGRPLPQPPRQHPAPGRAGAAGDHLHGPERPAVLRAGAHQGRAGLPADRGQPARRARLAPAALAPARDRPGQGDGRSWRTCWPPPSPLAALADGRDDGAGAGQEQGVLRRRSSPTSGRSWQANPETDPAAAIGAILQGGYPATVRGKYERPDNRLADIEQLAVLAARYDSLERLIAELLLAGDVYGVDSARRRRPGRRCWS